MRNAVRLAMTLAALVGCGNLPEDETGDVPAGDKADDVSRSARCQDAWLYAQVEGVDDDADAEREELRAVVAPFIAGFEEAREIGSAALFEFEWDLWESTWNPFDQTRSVGPFWAGRFEASRCRTDADVDALHARLRS